MPIKIRKNQVFPFSNKRCIMNTTRRCNFHPKLIICQNINYSPNTSKQKFLTDRLSNSIINYLTTHNKQINGRHFFKT